MEGGGTESLAFSPIIVVIGLKNLNAMVRGQFSYA